MKQIFNAVNHGYDIVRLLNLVKLVDADKNPLTS